MSFAIDLSGYDPRPGLSTSERRALAELMGSSDRSRTRLEQFPPELHRLLAPLEAVLVHDAVDGHVRANAYRVVVGAMHERGHSPWGWTHAEWVATLDREIGGAGARPTLTERCRAQLIMLAYLLVGFCDWESLRRVGRVRLASRAFGPEVLEAAVSPVVETLAGWGYRERSLKDVRLALCTALLARRSPRIADLDRDLLETLYAEARRRTVGYLALSRALAALGHIERPLTDIPEREQEWPAINPDTAPAQWTAWCRRWYCTSTLRVTTRDGYYALLLKAGRWLAATYPDVTEPGEWSRETAAAFVAAVERMVVRQWVLPNPR